MSGARSSTSSHPVSSGRAHYKMTRTVTGTDGKTHTETIEMVDDDAVKFMRNLRGNENNIPDFDRLGFRPLLNPANMSLFEPRSDRAVASQSRPASSSASKQPAVSQDPNDFLREALQVHNDLRRRHGVEPLKLNNDLSKLAQQWANHLASTGTLVHSKTKYRNVNVGENLRCQSWPMTGKEMTESWYNECKKYDYQNPSYQPGTGHFTQVVWKGSQEVGFAQAPGTSMNYAVAMYYPPGNYVGEFNRNVFAPR